MAPRVHADAGCVSFSSFSIPCFVAFFVTCFFIGLKQLSLLIFFPMCLFLSPFHLFVYFVSSQIFFFSFVFFRSSPSSIKPLHRVRPHIIIFTPAVGSQIDACRRCDPHRPPLHHAGQSRQSPLFFSAI
jgi:hypothetical protein